MPDQNKELKALGWNEWFEARVDLQRRPGDILARVAAVDRDLFLLLGTAGPFRGRISGNYRYRNELSRVFPCVGDWVLAEKNPADDYGLIHTLLERKTVLRRRSAGDTLDHQMIAANLDYVIIVQSCHYDFNLNRLQRYLVMVRDGGAEPIVLLTKTDLVGADLLADHLAAIELAGIRAPVFTLSNLTREGIDELMGTLLPSRTYCFVGSSGVGKSTLINRLAGRKVLETKEVSGSGEGRHTTVRRQLIVLDGGALVIDNPGMREFGLLDVDAQGSDGFGKILAKAAACRYRNCGHTSEPGCAVVEALNKGEIEQEHYDNYLKLRDESAYYQMSQVEKRKKDRDFGRFIKSAKKDLKNGK